MCPWFGNVLLRDHHDRSWLSGFAVLFSEVCQIHVFQNPEADPTRPLRLFSLANSLSSAAQVASVNTLLENGVDPDLEGHVLLLNQRRRLVLLCTRSVEEASACLQALSELNNNRESVTLTPKRAIEHRKAKEEATPLPPQISTPDVVVDATNIDVALHSAMPDAAQRLPHSESLAPKSYGSASTSLAELTNGKSLMPTSSALRQMHDAPKLHRLPRPFEQYFGRRLCWHFGYLVLRVHTQELFAVRFVLLIGGSQARLLIYESHESSPDDELCSLPLRTEDGFKGIARVNDESCRAGLAC